LTTVSTVDVLDLIALVLEFGNAGF